VSQFKLGSPRPEPPPEGVQISGPSRPLRPVGLTRAEGACRWEARQIALTPDLTRTRTTRHDLKFSPYRSEHARCAAPRCWRVQAFHEVLSKDRVRGRFPQGLHTLGREGVDRIWASGRSEAATDGAIRARLIGCGSVAPRGGPAQRCSTFKGSRLRRSTRRGAVHQPFLLPVTER
jgi:hypothetical protein